MVKKAFILAAGLGTRLGDHTKNKPKALVEVAGKPMLQNVIENLKNAGIDSFVINVHHFAEQVIHFLKKKNYFNTQISISDEREQLLDTGGALVKTKHLFKEDETILIHNVDVISDLNLEELYQYHKQQQSIATLSVRKRNSSRSLLFNQEMRLIGWRNKSTKEYKWTNEQIENYIPYAFSGIYLLNPAIINSISFKGKFSIIDAWLEIAKKNNISGFLDCSDFWFDLGTTEKINEAEKYLTNKKSG